MPETKLPLWPEDVLNYLEIARYALALQVGLPKGAEFADQSLSEYLDLSDNEFKRLQDQLEEYLQKLPL